MSYSAPAVPPTPAPIAALRPTLECVAAPIPAPAAPPTVAPVKVPQPPIASASKQRPQIDVVIHLKRSVIGHLLRGSNAQNMFHDSRRATGDSLKPQTISNHAN